MHNRFEVEKKKRRKTGPTETDTGMERDGGDRKKGKGSREKTMQSPWLKISGRGNFRRNGRRLRRIDREGRGGGSRSRACMCVCVCEGEWEEQIEFTVLLPLCWIDWRHGAHGVSRCAFVHLWTGVAVDGIRLKFDGIDKTRYRL